MNTIYEAYFLFYGFQIVLFTYLPTLFGVWIIVLVFEFFLVAFTKLFKATISLAMSVRQSVRMEQLGSHWTDFGDILY